MPRFKDYTNTVITNNNGDNILILSVDGKNTSGTYKWFYVCAYCGKISSDTISNIKKSNGCKMCRYTRSSDSKRLHLEEVKERIYNINPDFEVIGDYVNNSTPIKLLCKKHNVTFDAIPANIFSNESVMCPECIKEHKQLLYTKFTKKEILKILESNNYKWLNKNDYVNAASILECECLICGKISKFNIASIISGRKCRGCLGLMLKSTEQYKQEVFDIVGNEYEVIGKYTGNKKHILMKHNLCNNSWNATPTNFLYRSQRCPFCQTSKGEELISIFLDRNNIDYIPQYSFDDCVYINKLRFDFYLPSYNTLIEFQGKQHYQVIEYMGGITDFKLRQLRDDIKRKYCISNNINLLEIRYDEIDNINNILSSYLFEENKNVV